MDGFYPSGLKRARFAMRPLFIFLVVMTGFAGLLPAQATWTGTVSNAWGNTGNWSPATLPDAGTGVTIPGSLTTYPLISGATTALCNNLTVTGTLTIDTDGSLTVAGNIDGSGSLIILSAMASSGSMMVTGTSTGIVSYKRWMTGVSSGWHLVSSPVSGRSINDFALASGNAIATNSGYNPMRYAVGRYSESGHGWVLFNNGDIATAGNFILAKGYEVLRLSEGAVTFTGSLFSAPATYTMSLSAISDPGWNLVGNPFPSYLKANKDLDENYFLYHNRAVIDQNYLALYYWDPSNPTQYIALNYSSAESMIAPAQGFFVKAASAAAIEFDANMRSHTSGSFGFKSGNDYQFEIELLSASAANRKTTLIFDRGMTPGLDPGYDAGNYDAPGYFDLYTGLVEDNGYYYSIQCLPEDYKDVFIPVGIRAPAGATVTLSAGITNLPKKVEIYLYDKLMGIFTRLDEAGSSYTVTFASATSGTGRFWITFDKTKPGRKKDGLLIPEVNEPARLTILPLPLYQVIRISGEIDGLARASVYDMNGRMILSETISGPGNHELKADRLNNGVYLLVIDRGGTVDKQKISWIQ